MLGCNSLVAAELLHKTVEAWKAPARKQSHAPFFPPEKEILPPSTNVVGLAVTVTPDAPSTVMTWSVTFAAALSVSPSSLQWIQLTFVSEAFVQLSNSGDVSQDATGAVHTLLFVALVLISTTFPGAPQTAAVGVLELWLRHSHAPFLPPEKAI
jgi:hypothetical protein